jgi:hypothetical protein
MVTFVLKDSSYDEDGTSYVVAEHKTMLEAKQFIMNELELSCSYIDFDCCLDRPMRIEGKFNIEPGKLSRTFDRYTLNQFAFKDKLPVKLIEVTDYDPHKPKPKFISGGRGRGRGIGMSGDVGLSHPQSSQSTFNTNLTQMDFVDTFDLNSQNDFPALGS